ncbi:hypothetical protein BJ993_001428 [Nocardioides aromaticivorans]|uniref:Uncharacterized protein n=1 Tax=Nocardioides aromaticivorans TaxID=200618 RepID=A0A7Y9ZHH5_9ACTN|nr:hypothetical protein [Nocardioides aromaticivorans]NYI44348.1 hypothetical protein [Nocardioides aromaticivorans]
MNTPTAETLMTAAVRQLDPAPPAELTDAQRERADAMFARIVATPAEGGVPVEPVRPRRRRRLLVGLGLASATGVAVPALLVGGGGAYGSWTPEPETLTGTAAARAGDVCRTSHAFPDARERVVVAERRGEWTYVLLSGPAGEATCLMPEEMVERGVRSVDDDYFGSYDADPPAAPVVAAGDIEETGAMSGSTDEGWFTWTAGFVGKDVTAVTVHTSSGLDIEASVVGNRFAAWWPGVPPSSANPDDSWSFTVHLADGTSRDITQ